MTDQNINANLSLQGVRVAAIVTNPCAPDPRVMKQAESAAKAGAEVTIFCLQDEGVPNEETLNGVRYKRFSNFKVVSSQAPGIFFSSLKEDTLRTIFFLIAFISLASLKGLSWIYQKVKTTLGFKNDKTRSSFLYGPKSIFRPILHALYVFVRGDIYKYILSPSVINYQPDLIHAHDFTTVPTALYCATKTNAKVIFDAHEIEADRVGSNGASSVAIINKDLNHFLPNVDALISVNESALNFYLENYKFQEIPKAVIYNSPAAPQDTIDNNKAKPINLREQLNIQESEILFIYTGSIGIGRGVPEIVQAMEPIKNTHLCIMGPQRDNILYPFQEHVQALKMEQRVHIIAPVSHDAVTETVKSADAGILFTLPTCLNHLYCLPNKIFESAMAGLPIIGPDLPEIKKFIEEEEIGLVVESENIDLLSEAIKEMAQDPLKYRPSERKLEDLKEKWSWDAQAAKLVPFYQDILKGKK